MSTDRGALHKQLPCEDIETALRTAAPYFSGTAPRSYHSGVFDIRGGELYSVYFHKIGTALREDVRYIMIKTASGLLETEYHKA